MVSVCVRDGVSVVSIEKKEESVGIVGNKTAFRWCLNQGVN